MIKANVYPHIWGVIIPCKSGVMWEQQTEGVSCCHVHIEGIYIPLKKPFLYPKDKDPEDLLERLMEQNYNFYITDETWEDIKEAMNLEFIDIDAPMGMPPTQEGIRWIRIIKFGDDIGYIQDTKDLEGKEVVLIYPNCD